MKHASPPSIFTSRRSFSRQSPAAPTPAGSASATSSLSSSTLAARSPRDSSSPRRQSSAGRDDYPAHCSVSSAVDPTVNASSLVTGAPASAPATTTASAFPVAQKPTALAITTTSPAPSPWAPSADRIPAPLTPPAADQRSRTPSTDQAGASYLTSPVVSSPNAVPAKRRQGSTTSAPEHLPASEPLRKRPRLRPRHKHTLDPNSYNTNNFHAIISPPSPLFFSNTPQLRPTLPPRFSSSEAGARMLSKARTEDSHVKTVSLARGTIRTPGGPPPPPTSTPGSRRSVERSTTGRSNSPDVAGYSGINGILSSIGIVELLDQDDRPTFIIDLSDSSNYGPGPLHLLFANASLRSFEGMQATVMGISPEHGDPSSPGTRGFLQFKSWLLSAAINGESLDVCLPPFTYHGMTWSCSTLRKKLRLISGAFNSPPPSSAAALNLTVPPQNSLPADAETATTDFATEPTDYFFPVPEVTPSNAMEGVTTNTANEILPSIEATKSDFAPSEPSELELSSVVDVLPSTSTMVGSSTRGAGPATTPRGMSIVSDSPHREDRLHNAPWSPPTEGALAPQIDAPSFDWTRIPVTSAMPEHIRFARSIDWAATSLGPIEDWSSDLRQMCNLIMASPHPSAMYWGEDLVAIYNEAYVILAGQKHPRLMGMSYREAWAEIWDEVKDAFANAKSTGEATMKDDDCLFIRRNDYLEETYFSWSIIPMVGQDGSVMGLHNPAFEKTRRKIAERRMLTLREIGERTAAARDVKGFWSQVLGSFEFNEYDSPFLLLYSVADEVDTDDSSSLHSNSVLAPRYCTLEGSLGVPDNHPAAAARIDLRAGMDGFGPVFREVVNTDKPVLLEVGSRDLPESLVEGLEMRGFGDPVRAVVVCPIHPTTGESVLGFLVLGINPRRPYDDDYSLFVQLLSRQLATSLASVVLFEEEIRRGQRAAKLAALDRIELSEQLAARTQEAIDSETKFTRMAEFAPVGMFIADRHGKITFANDTWYDISRVPRNTHMADTWMEAVKPEDTALVEKLWNDLVADTNQVSSEFRFKAPWQDRSGNKSDTWVLFSAYPETDSDGKLKSIFGSITNISQQKWAEGIQTRKMEEAVELKRQQENFIDITSHEMRNPLSAILQCADEISTSLTQYRDNGEQMPLDDLLSSCLDAAQTISLCSQHQKRIVDDILTLSKLDSQLLLVTPVDAQPLTVVQRALKMHEGELQAADIQMKFIVDQSYRDLELDWVRFDPSRVLQVLLNLTTNAIKFTGSESKRTISVTIGASRNKPDGSSGAPVQYFATRTKNKDSMGEKDWGHGEKVYIHFAVRDTGRGLSPEEKKLLFIRFSQASPRTHVQYGGSGLGLFISRELTEMQGGEIGVESEAGKGSIFAFYVAARRSNPPKDTIDGGTGIKRTESRRQTDPSLKGSTSITQQPGAKMRSFSTSTTANGDKRLVPRVLIIEDNLVNQRVLQKQLKNLGTQVHLANHGGEALDRLKQSTYWRTDGEHDANALELGVLLMDQEMPVMDGLTCTRRIRELEAEGKLTGHVPIIAVTANARPEQIQTALDAGMDDVVSKPFRIPELMPKIQELMERFTTSRSLATT